MRKKIAGILVGALFCAKTFADVTVAIPVTVSINSYCSLVESPSGIEFDSNLNEVPSFDFTVTWECFTGGDESVSLYFDEMVLPTGHMVVVTPVSGDPKTQSITRRTPLVTEATQGEPRETQFTAHLINPSQSQRGLGNWSGAMELVLKLDK